VVVTDFTEEAALMGAQLLEHLLQGERQGPPEARHST
jgi:hypothetical protein